MDCNKIRASLWTIAMWILSQLVYFGGNFISAEVLRVLQAHVVLFSLLRVHSYLTRQWKPEYLSNAGNLRVLFQAEYHQPSCLTLLSLMHFCHHPYKQQLFFLGCCCHHQQSSLKNSSWFLMQLRTPWRHNDFLTTPQMEPSVVTASALRLWVGVAQMVSNTIRAKKQPAWCLALHSCRRFWIKQGKSPTEYIHIYIYI